MKFSRSKHIPWFAGVENIWSCAVSNVSKSKSGLLLAKHWHFSRTRHGNHLYSLFPSSFGHRKRSQWPHHRCTFSCSRNNHVILLLDIQVILKTTILNRPKAIWRFPLPSSPPPYSLPKLSHPLTATPTKTRPFTPTRQPRTPSEFLVGLLFGCIAKAIFAEPMQLGTVGVVAGVAWEVRHASMSVVSPKRVLKWV